MKVNKKTRSLWWNVKQENAGLRPNHSTAKDHWHIVYLNAIKYISRLILATQRKHQQILHWEPHGSTNKNKQTNNTTGGSLQKTQCFAQQQPDSFVAFDGSFRGSTTCCCCCCLFWPRSVQRVAVTPTPPGAPSSDPSQSIMGKQIRLSWIYTFSDQLSEPIFNISVRSELNSA